MMRVYLIGMLSGVMIATAFTYVFAIPANSDYWRMEIYKRGGAAWTFDMKSGRMGWKWMVDPIPDTPSSPKRAVLPPSRGKGSQRAAVDRTNFLGRGSVRNSGIAIACRIIRNHACSR